MTTGAAGESGLRAHEANGFVSDKRDDVQGPSVINMVANAGFLNFDTETGVNVSMDVSVRPLEALMGLCSESLVRKGRL